MGMFETAPRFSSIVELKFIFLAILKLYFIQNIYRMIHLNNSCVLTAPTSQISEASDDVLHQL
jgi:hypothetical protein